MYKFIDHSLKLMSVLIILTLLSFTNDLFALAIDIGNITISDNDNRHDINEADNIIDFNNTHPTKGFPVLQGYNVSGTVKLGPVGGSTIYTVGFTKVITLTNFRCVRAQGPGGDLVIDFYHPFERYTVLTSIVAGDGIIGSYINIIAPHILGGGNIVRFQGFLNDDPIWPPGWSGVSAPNGGQPTPVDLGPYGNGLLSKRALAVRISGCLRITLGAIGDGIRLPNSAEVGFSDTITIPTLIMLPRTSVNPINTQHCVNVVVLDINGPVVGATVDFERIGANPGTGFAITDSGGIAEYCYIGTNMGTDNIIGSAMGLKDTVYNF